MIRSVEGGLPRTGRTVSSLDWSAFGRLPGRGTARERSRAYVGVCRDRPDFRVFFACAVMPFLCCFCAIGQEYDTFDPVSPPDHRPRRQRKYPYHICLRNLMSVCRSNVGLISNRHSVSRLFVRSYRTECRLCRFFDHNTRIREIIDPWFRHDLGVLFFTCMWVYLRRTDTTDTDLN